MKYILILGMLGLAACGPGPTAIEEPLEASHVCHGIVIEDTVYVNTHQPLVPAGQRFPGRRRRSVCPWCVRWRVRQLPYRIDTIPIQVFVQICPPHAEVR